MAIYHFHAQTINRSAGRSATAAAAYRAGEEIADERQGLTHDYTQKGGVLHTEIMTPNNAPAWASDRSKLWNAVERSEKRKDAQVAREVDIAIPHELNEIQRIELIRGFVKEQFVDRGMIADMAFHAPDIKGNLKNLHVHVMLTMRDISPDGFSDKKNRDWNDKQLLETWRAQWAAHANRALEAAGSDARIDHRTLEAQHIEALENGDLEAARVLDRAPQIHQGPRVTQILREAEGEGREPLGALDRAAANDDLAFDLDAGRKELAEVISMIDFIEKRDAERESARTEAEHEKGLRKQLAEAKEELSAAEKEKGDLGEKYFNGTPGYVIDIRRMRKEVKAAEKKADAWREEHPRFSQFAKKFNIKLETDVAAIEIKEKFMKLPERKKEIAWTKEYVKDTARIKELSATIEVTQAKVDRLETEVASLNRPDPEVLQTIKEEVAAGVEHARPQIAEFVDNNRSDIAAAADIGVGVDAWISTEIIATGNPVIDELSRKAAQFKSRMLREETARADKIASLMDSAVRRHQAAFKKALDASFRSAARDAEPRIDHTAGALRIAAEDAAAALRAPKAEPAEYVPTWKRGRQHDGYEPGR